jgi:hypothetical protein
LSTWGAARPENPTAPPERQQVAAHPL